MSISDVEAHFTSKLQVTFQSQEYESFMDFVAVFYTESGQVHLSLPNGCGPRTKLTNSGSRYLSRWRLPAHTPVGGELESTGAVLCLTNWLVDNCLNRGPGESPVADTGLTLADDMCHVCQECEHSFRAGNELSQFCRSNTSILPHGSGLVAS